MGGGATLVGERIAFTGRLASMSRREAARRIEALGGSVSPSLSGRTTMLVVGMHGWPLRADGGVSARLRQAERLRARVGAPRIVPEIELLERLGMRERAEDDPKTFPIERVAGIVGVAPELIRHWERLGLVRSHDGACDFRDIVSLQTIASLVQRGVELGAIQRSLVALSAILPGTDRPLAQLRIVDADGGALLAQIGDALITPDGQQVLDFAGHSRVARQTSLDEPRILEPEPDDRATPEALFERALDLEDQERYEEAAGVYRRVFALEPGRSEVLYNLGNALRQAGLRPGAGDAEEAYRLAVALDPANALAWYNLADLLEEGGRVDEAVTCLEHAIDADEAFADALFNLAFCLEQLGRRDEAARMWRRYLRLDANSEWAGVAREHLNTL